VDGISSKGCFKMISFRALMNAKRPYINSKWISKAICWRISRTLNGRGAFSSWIGQPESPFKGLEVNDSKAIEA
jgi:hypothetical protein